MVFERYGLLHSQVKLYASPCEQLMISQYYYKLAKSQEKIKTDWHWWIIFKFICYCTSFNKYHSEEVSPHRHSYLYVTACVDVCVWMQPGLAKPLQTCRNMT